MDNPDYEKLLLKARDVVQGGEKAWSKQSTSERLAVAMILDRYDWLQAMSYTIADAIQRVGEAWIRQVPFVADAIRQQELEQEWEEDERHNAQS